MSNLSTVVAEVMQTTSRPRGTVIKLAEVITFDLEFLQQTPPLFLSDPCAHGVRSLGYSNVCHSQSFLKPCEDQVKTVNVVNVVKI